MSSLPNHINWGIIGCGDVTEKKSGPAFNKVPNSSLVAVMRRDMEKAKDYARRHGVPKYYAHATELINDPEINAIYIATPPGSHETYAIEALEAGKPVYVEKPMSVDIASCSRMLDAAQRNSGKLSIAHYRRALPMFLKIKELITVREIGEIRTVRISMLQPNKSGLITETADNWRVNPAIAGAGLFYDLAPHQLDLVMYFFGHPRHAFGFSANQAGFYEAEDIVSGLMELPEKILFNGHWCYTVGEGIEEDLFEIIGSKGKICFPVFGQTITIQQGSSTEVLHFEHPEHIQQPMIEKIVGYFLGKTENPCSAKEAMESMRVMESFAYGKPF
ncbi:MAG: hypothetical protein RLZZ28_2582 [Bacteroidota bacterium]|jgi:predicted dehydrogenase